MDLVTFEIPFLVPSVITDLAITSISHLNTYNDDTIFDINRSFDLHRILLPIPSRSKLSPISHDLYVTTQHLVWI